MSNLPAIQQTLNSKIALENLRMAIGKNADMEEAKEYAAGVLNEIRRSEGNEYGDLTVCSPDSIVHAMLDAAKFKVKIDGRKLAHLEVRYNKNRKCSEASLMIDTNGFVFKIAEQYPDVVFSDVTIFEGDEFEIVEKDGLSEWIYKSKNPFQSLDKLIGIAVKISYTENGTRIQTVEPISKAELLVMQSKGKGTAWKEFPLERMRTAAIKRACKWHFRKITGLVDIIDYDNQRTIDMQKPAQPEKPNIIDNLNAALIPAPTEVIEQKPEGDV